MDVDPVIAVGVPGPPDGAVPPEYEIKAEKLSLIKAGMGSPLPASTLSVQQPEQVVVRFIEILDGPLSDIPQSPA
jgi:hypothetical protein